MGKYSNIVSSGSSGGSALNVNDEGIVLDTSVTKINFIGSSVTSVENEDHEIDVTITPATAPVDSVNTQTGEVVLDADDISDTSTTNKYTTSDEITKLLNIEIEATADQTSSEVPVIDTNDHYVGTDVESVLAEVGETRNINGYDLTNPNSMPDIAFDNSTRTFSCSVKTGQPSFYFWADDKKITKTTTQSIQLLNTTGTYYIVFNTSGTLTAVTEDVVTQDDFYAHAITGLVYWNATAQTGLAGNEMHGKLMDPRTHHYNHSTFGARYEPGGININGLVDRSKTYTETTSGYFWDEDIRHIVPLQTTHPFIYRLGATGEWTATAPDNSVGFENGTGDVVFNEWTGTIWQLTQSGSTTDYIIHFFMATPDISGFPIKKVIGQHGYKDRNAARNAIISEMNSISTEGLPSPEFIFLYAYIVRQSGDLEDLEDGSTYYDLRLSKGGAAGSSGSASVAADINVGTTNFDNLLSAADTTTQLALETLDDHTHDIVDGGVI